LSPSASGQWHFLERAGLYLAIGVPAIATIAIIWFYSPNIAIQPAAVLNPLNAVDAEFTITNTGHVTVYNLLFQCEIIRDNGTHFTTSANIVHLPSGRVVEQSISTLSPNEGITTHCGSGGTVSAPLTVARYPASIIATANYTWPLVKWTGSRTRRFNSRQDQSRGIVLVPEP
jgi:hypothetical protein